jgi:NAD(P)-dependent dehydrogenase (short-subunit alcohol dehydrogenase family)
VLGLGHLRAADLATYSATKFAVRGLSEALDLEWEKEGISVTAIWPLFVNTAMVDGWTSGPSANWASTSWPRTWPMSSLRR